MSKFSRDKGKRGEREFAKLLSEHGFQAWRGVQYQGGPDSPDIVCKDLPAHFEVKRTEKINIYQAYAQAAQDAAIWEWPVVAHRKNGDQWMVFMSAVDFLEVVRWEGKVGTEIPSPTSGGTSISPKK